MFMIGQTVKCILCIKNVREILFFFFFFSFQISLDKFWRSQKFLNKKIRGAIFFIAPGATNPRYAPVYHSSIQRLHLKFTSLNEVGADCRDRNWSTVTRMQWSINKASVSLGYQCDWMYTVAVPWGKRAPQDTLPCAPHMTDRQKSGMCCLKYFVVTPSIRYFSSLLRWFGHQPLESKQSV